MKKKPDYIPNVFDMSHVPPPDPANYWKLPLHESRVIMADTSSGDIRPMLTITVRDITDGVVSLQITADPSIRAFYKQ
jgi:hypothetical protein